MLSVRELIRELEKMPQNAKVKEQPQPQEEELVNLCPECSLFCEERFTDGQCK